MSGPPPPFAGGFPGMPYGGYQQPPPQQAGFPGYGMPGMPPMMGGMPPPMMGGPPMQMMGAYRPPPHLGVQMPPRPSFPVASPSSSTNFVKGANLAVISSTIGGGTISSSVPPSLEVFIGGIGQNCDEAFLKSVLEAVGELKNFKWVMNVAKDECAGFAYCTFSKSEETQRAIRLLDGFNLDVKISDTKEEPDDGEGSLLPTSTKLLVKVGRRVQESIDQWELMKTAETEGNELDHSGKDTEVQLEIETMISKRNTEEGEKKPVRGREQERERRAALDDDDDDELIGNTMMKEALEKEKRGTEGKSDEADDSKLAEGEIRETVIRETVIKLGESGTQEACDEYISRFRNVQLKKEKKMQESRRKRIKEVMALFLRTGSVEEKPEDAREREREARDGPRVERMDQSSIDDLIGSGRRAAERDRGSDDRDRDNDRDRDRERRRRRSGRSRSRSEERKKSRRNEGDQKAEDANANAEDATPKKMAFSLGASTGSKSKSSSKAIFNEEEDDGDKAKRAIVPLDYTEEEKRAAMPEDERLAAAASLDQKRQELIAQIPKSKDALYKYPIDWDTCDKKNIVDKIMKPWIVKKIVEYLGEEEDTLVSFILSKLNSRSEPAAILTELSLVLEDDADSFIEELWKNLAKEIINTKDSL